jgi:hypothetical protein
MYVLTVLGQLRPFAATSTCSRPILAQIRWYPKHWGPKLLTGWQMRTNQHQDSFGARLDRINNPKNTFYTDAETGMKIPKRVSKKTILAKKKSRKPGQGPVFLLLSLPVALAMGAACLAFSRYMRFVVFETPILTDTVMVVEIALAAVLAFIIGGIIKLKTTRHMFFQVLGAAVMAVAMHNLVWLAPDAFGQYYSQTYVDQVQAETVPSSLLIRGAIYEI